MGVNMEHTSFVMELVDLDNQNHVDALLALMNDYMLDDMGLNSPLSAELGQKIVVGLRNQSNYIGFLLKSSDLYVALANSFVGFSTFKAKRLINIHDFVVTKSFRRQGVAKVFLNSIKQYGGINDYCKVTLEVRHDNPKAQSLYRKLDFNECEPPMYFWQTLLPNS